MIVRTMVVGANVVFERGKLWPQGPKQTLVGQLSYEVYVRTAIQAQNPNDPENNQHLRRALAELPKAKEDMRLSGAGSDVIEAIVGDMYLIGGNIAKNEPATIEILGQAFGEWLQRGGAPSVNIPQSLAIWERAWPIEELFEHAAELEAAADQPDDDEDEEDEDEEEDEDDEDGEGGGDGLEAEGEAPAHGQLSSGEQSGIGDPPRGPSGLMP
jgi:hypothetical protein